MGHTKIVAGLHPQPEALAEPEESAEAQIGIRRNRPPAFWKAQGSRCINLLLARIYRMLDDGVTHCVCHHQIDLSGHALPQVISYFVVKRRLTAGDEIGEVLMGLTPRLSLR